MDYQPQFFNNKIKVNKENRPLLNKVYSKHIILFLLFNLKEENLKVKETYFLNNFTVEQFSLHLNNKIDSRYH